MPVQKDDLSQVKRAVAVLATCIVQTLNESDQVAQARFLERLSRAYATVRDGADQVGVVDLEVLAWTRELLTGFNFSTGQGTPFNP